VALSVTEFRSSKDVDFLLSVGLKISVTNISGPDFKVIEFSDKSEKSDTMKGNNTGVFGIDRRFREAASGDETSFVSSIVFDCMSAGQLCDLRTRPVHVASRTAIYGFSTTTDDATALR